MSVKASLEAVFPELYPTDEPLEAPEPSDAAEPPAAAAVAPPEYLRPAACIPGAAGRFDFMASEVRKGSVFEYGSPKSCLGFGSYGVVFGTHDAQKKPITVKLTRVPRRYTEPEKAIFQRGTAPMVHAAAEEWKHVVHALTHFVHEGLKNDLKNLYKFTDERSPALSENASPDVFFLEPRVDYMARR